MHCVLPRSTCEMAIDGRKYELEYEYGVEPLK